MELKSIIAPPEHQPEELNSKISESMENLQSDSINGVIRSLDKIILWSKHNQKKTGYFAALYRKVTIKVKEGIDSGEFEDGERMERLDVIFANRYLEAFEQYCASQKTTKCWSLAFELGDKWEPIALQHLMIGMNAHINLDLGIAAAQTVTPENLSDLKNDFEKINSLLAALVDELQSELAEIWPFFKLIDKFAGNTDEALANFGMKIARGKAWQLALDYAKENPDKQHNLIEAADCKVYLLGNLLAKPGLRLRLILLLIRFGEPKRVSKIIEILE
ncbi:MAG: DUF5995 family protein [Gammaproteobacteria bacterium]|nr:DUF5995 family protein [Gammaproteobacteria bacterium]